MASMIFENPYPRGDKLYGPREALIRKQKALIQCAKPGQIIKLGLRPSYINVEVCSKTGKWKHETLGKPDQATGIIPLRVQKAKDIPANQGGRSRQMGRSHDKSHDKVKQILVAAFTTSDGERFPARKVTASRTVDMVPGFAVTFHKCQGATLGKVMLDLSQNPIAPLNLEMIYVGLTRVRTGEDLRILPLVKTQLKSDTINCWKKLRTNPTLLHYLSCYDADGIFQPVPEKHTNSPIKRKKATDSAHKKRRTHHSQLEVRDFDSNQRRMVCRRLDLCEDTEVKLRTWPTLPGKTTTFITAALSCLSTVYTTHLMGMPCEPRSDLDYFHNTMIGILLPLSQSRRLKIQQKELLQMIGYEESNLRETYSRVSQIMRAHPCPNDNGFGEPHPADLLHSMLLCFNWVSRDHASYLCGHHASDSTTRVCSSTAPHLCHFVTVHMGSHNSAASFHDLVTSAAVCKQCRNASKSPCVRMSELLAIRVMFAKNSRSNATKLEPTLTVGGCCYTLVSIIRRPTKPDTEKNILKKPKTQEEMRAYHTAIRCGSTNQWYLRATENINPIPTESLVEHEGVCTDYEMLLYAQPKGSHTGVVNINLPIKGDMLYDEKQVRSGRIMGMVPNTSNFNVVYCDTSEQILTKRDAIQQHQLFRKKCRQYGQFVCACLHGKGCLERFTDTGYMGSSSWKAEHPQGDCKRMSKDSEMDQPGKRPKSDHHSAGAAQSRAVTAANGDTASKTVGVSGTSAVTRTLVGHGTHFSSAPHNRPLGARASRSLSHGWSPLVSPAGECTGLMNLGNTCFANVVVRTLLCTPMLMNVLVSNESVSAMTRRAGLLANSMLDTTPDATNSNLATAVFLENSLLALSRCNQAYVAPEQVTGHQALVHILPHHRRSQQEDAEEYFSAFLNKLVAGELQYGKRAGIYMTEENTLIHDVFGYCIRQHRTCTGQGCKDNHIRHTIGEVLPLPMIHDSDNVPQDSTILRLIQDLFRGVLVDYDSQEKTCDHKDKSLKQSFFYQQPNVLVLHLARWNWNDGTGNKLHTNVEFEADLNVESVMAQDVSNPARSTLYHLYSIIVHLGEKRNNGHYVAYVKHRDDKWYLHNDAEVRCVDFDIVVKKQSRNAYMLFYQNVDTAAQSSMTVRSTSAPGNQKMEEQDPVAQKRTNPHRRMAGNFVNGAEGQSSAARAKTIENSDNDSDVEILSVDDAPQKNQAWKGTFDALLHHLNLERVPNEAEIDKPGDCLPLTIRDIAAHCKWEQQDWRQVICDVYATQQSLMKSWSGLWERDGSRQCVKESCLACKHWIRQLNNNPTESHQPCREHTCTACKNRQCMHRPPMTVDNTAVESFIAWLRQDQRWMSFVEVCTYADEIHNRSAAQRRLIMIKKLPTGGALMYCSQKHSSQPRTSNPWEMIQVQLDELDPEKDVYMLYTGNNHFSFAKPFLAHPSDDVHQLESCSRAVDACGDGNGKHARAGLHGNVQHHPAKMVTAFKRHALVLGFEIGDETAHDFLNKNNWNVEDSISEWTSMMIDS